MLRIVRMIGTMLGDTRAYESGGGVMGRSKSKSRGSAHACVLADLGARDRLEAARRAKGVAGHAFGRRDVEIVRMISEDALEGGV